MENHGYLPRPPCVQWNGKFGSGYKIGVGCSAGCALLPCVAFRKRANMSAVVDRCYSEAAAATGCE